MEPEEDTYPLIYAAHCKNRFVRWLLQMRKPNAIVEAAEAPTHLIHFNGERLLDPYGKCESSGHSPNGK